MDSSEAFLKLKAEGLLSGKACHSRLSWFPSPSSPLSQVSTKNLLNACSTGGDLKVPPRSSCCTAVQCSLQCRHERVLCVDRWYWVPAISGEDQSWSEWENNWGNNNLLYTSNHPNKVFIQKSRRMEEFPNTYVVGKIDNSPSFMQREGKIWTCWKISSGLFGEIRNWRMVNGIFLTVKRRVTFCLFPNVAHHC